MARGTVKWFSPVRGYGFIAPDAGRDCFVHYSAIVGQGRRNLVAAQRVESMSSRTQMGSYGR